MRERLEEGGRPRPGYREDSCLTEIIKSKSSCVCKGEVNSFWAVLGSSRRLEG